MSDFEVSQPAATQWAGLTGMFRLFRLHKFNGPENSKKKYFAAYGHFTYVITLHYIEAIFSGLSKNHTPLKGV